MLKPYFYKNTIEAGCDEAGRGCLAGPVTAAAVILPSKFSHSVLNDSKKLSPSQRERLREEITGSALAWSVAFLDNNDIDKMNILRASILAMHKALDGLDKKPELILVDGNRFFPYNNIDYRTIVKGDSIYFSIAAASVLAKTYRDAYMKEIDAEYPMYGWAANKGYPTEDHRRALLEYGPSPYHRKSFALFNTQMKIEF